MLTMKVFDKEIFEAVKHIDPLKASGPDVMKANFYHQSWNSVGNSVCKVAKSFFTYRNMIQELKRTYITLIPRSITGIVFIIIDLLLRHSKLLEDLASRLKKVIPKTIPHLQRAFIYCRDIHDDTLVAHEILNYFSKRQLKQDFMTIILDMEKAYYRNRMKIHLEIFY